jgi:hypothetical protein
MSNKFSLSGLKDIYNQALSKNEFTISFEVNNGKGRFLFTMLFDEEDQETKDKLYIFMRNTKKMLMRKLYGNHSKGYFDFYLDPQHESMIKAELMIGNNHSHPFNLSNFIQELNSSMPKNLPLDRSIYAFRESWNDTKDYFPKNIVDENEKTILIGDRALPDGKKPREKTLRKLYLYDTRDYRDIAEYIAYLKRVNRTVAWTHDLDRLVKNK